MPQDLLTALLYLLLGGLLNYVINQLPSLKQFRGSGILLVMLAIELLVLGWIWQVSSAGDNLYQAHQDWFDGGKLLLLGALAVNLLLLVVGLLRGETSQSTVPQPNLRDRLLQAELEEVDKRKADSLHRQILIDLAMTDVREQVGRPSKQLVTNGTTVDLPAATRMIEVFRLREVGGRLLLLGDPGAGKTTMLLELAESLLEIGQQDLHAPVPVILELSTWREDQKTLADWLIEQLWQKYKLDRNISREWLASGQVLPLLDGLDELGLGRQRKAMAAINQYLAADGKLDLVVCCRREEYQESQSQLTQLKGAICLQPLTDSQIQKYLRQLGKTALWRQIQSDYELLELSRLPLLLHIMVLAYRDQPIRNRQALFDTYILRRFELPPQKCVYPVGKAPSQLQTRHYLVWLAKQMRSEYKTVFLIERLQPSGLITRQQKWLYRLIGGLIIGLIWGLIGGLIIGLLVGLLEGVSLGLIIGLIIGLFFGLGSIAPVEAVQISITHLSKQETLEKLRSELLIRLLVGLPLGLLVGLFWGLFFGLTYGLTYGLIGGLTFGLFFGLIEPLKIDLQTRLSPNEGIKASARNVAILMLLILLIFLSAWFFLNPFIQWTVDKDASMLFSALLAGTLFVSFYYCGGFACIQHFALRIVLWQSNVAPWNYAKFLEYASDRRFIQQVGGRYRFIHRLVTRSLRCNGIEIDPAIASS